MPFGYSLMIDMYGCNYNALDDLELHYRVLEDLVDALGMTKMTTPICVHGPNRLDSNGRRIDLYPEKLGVSGWVGLIESGIQIHSCQPTKFSTIDIYSCNDFISKSPMLKDILYGNFKYMDYEENFIVRGTKYAPPINKK